ncbi:hypothetical protein [Nocardioides euryhalodurans]|uniref:DUF559 domain-containing protein n=1 Tax=Nocardioides euryhalodurans TaxID=2518370 RepID=A0A4V1BE28_9ACTN|nr:hypothetical protein [Nocardioides euryhalodurans]QBR93172.1 hypothetical protein EXE57_13525 [Nocardioides euryhalodurans]
MRPARIDPAGLTGPTRGQTQRGRFRQVSHGWYVPADVDSSRVEQRILEQGMRVRGTGAVTGWAALRWLGAAYFDGTVDAAGTVLPVDLLQRSGYHPWEDDRARRSRRQLPPYDRQFVHGLWCTTAQRALFDEVRRRRTLRPAVAAICMTLASGITTRRQLREYAELRVAWEGIPLFRDALALSSEGFRSGPEVYLFLRWVLDAGLPVPLVNRPVFDLRGRLLGYPDLLDPVAGVVGEYDGAAHRGRDRHRRDVAREQCFRDVGLEYFTVVAGDLSDERLVVDRIRSTRARARFGSPSERQWTLAPPPWWRTPPPRDT